MPSMHIFQIITAKSLTELYESMGNASSFLEIAGCYIAVHDVKDKEKVANAAIKFHVIDRVRHSIDR